MNEMIVYENCFTLAAEKWDGLYDGCGFEAKRRFRLRRVWPILHK